MSGLKRSVLCVAAGVSRVAATPGYAPLTPLKGAARRVTWWAEVCHAWKCGCTRLVFSHALSCHNNYFPKPRGRSVKFSWVFFHVQGTAALSHPRWAHEAIHGTTHNNLYESISKCECVGRDMFETMGPRSVAYYKPKLCRCEHPQRPRRKKNYIYFFFIWCCLLHPEAF